MMDLQEKARVVMKLLSDVNEMEKTISRLHNELTKEYMRIDDALDAEGFKANPLLQENKTNNP